MIESLKEWLTPEHMMALIAVATIAFVLGNAIGAALAWLASRADIDDII